MNYILSYVTDHVESGIEEVGVVSHGHGQQFVSPVNLLIQFSVIEQSESL